MDNLDINLGNRNNYNVMRKMLYDIRKPNVNVTKLIHSSSMTARNIHRCAANV